MGKRYNVVSMRISDEERKHLDTIAQRTHKSVSDIMREAMNMIAMQIDHKSYQGVNLAS